jgi:hypothetical protein
MTSTTLGIGGDSACSGELIVAGQNQLLSYDHVPEVGSSPTRPTTSPKIWRLCWNPKLTKSPSAPESRTAQTAAGQRNWHLRLPFRALERRSESLLLEDCSARIISIGTLTMRHEKVD